MRFGLCQGLLRRHLLKLVQSSLIIVEPELLGVMKMAACSRMRKCRGQRGLLTVKTAPSTGLHFSSGGRQPYFFLILDQRRL